MSSKEHMIRGNLLSIPLVVSNNQYSLLFLEREPYIFMHLCKVVSWSSKMKTCNASLSLMGFVEFSSNLGNMIKVMGRILLSEISEELYTIINPILHGVGWGVHCAWISRELLAASRQTPQMRSDFMTLFLPIF